MFSSLSSSPSSERISALGPGPIGLRQRLEVQPVEELAMDVGLQLRVLRVSAGPAAAPGLAAAARRNDGDVGRRLSS